MAQNRHVEKEYTGIEFNPRHAEALTPEDYLEAKEKYARKLTIHYIKTATISFFYSKREGHADAMNITILFLDEEAMRELFSISQTEGKYYMGSAVKEKPPLLGTFSPQEMDGKSIQPKHDLLDKDKKILPLKEGLDFDGKAFHFEFIHKDQKDLPLSGSSDLSASIASSKGEEHTLALKDCILLPFDEARFCVFLGVGLSVSTVL